MNSVQISRFTEDGIKEVKEIYELSEDNTVKYRILGQPTGINMEHCVILGLKHKERFWNRVYGYRIIKNEAIEKMLVEAMRKIKPEIESYITVCFYERRTDQNSLVSPEALSDS